MDRYEPRNGLLPTPFPAPIPGELPAPIPRIPGPAIAGARRSDPTNRDETRREEATCFWCGRLHAARHALSVCPTCAAKSATMRSLEMRGCFPLSATAIDERLTRISPGNYALGYLDGEDFTVFYVGRSDSDVRRRLREWVGTSGRFDRYASPSKAAWGMQGREGFPIDAPALDRVCNAESEYTHFAYSYARSADEAYAKEWRNYDLFGGSHGLDNDSDPFSAPA
jgi:hypothetical protein